LQRVPLGHDDSMVPLIVWKSKAHLANSDDVHESLIW
jgi:hypothetical protein